MNAQYTNRESDFTVQITTHYTQLTHTGFPV